MPSRQWQWQQRQLEEGLCTKCDQPLAIVKVVPNVMGTGVVVIKHSAYCERHREEHNKWNKDRRARLKSMSVEKAKEEE